MRPTQVRVMDFARNIHFKAWKDGRELVLKDIVVIDITRCEDVRGIGREVKARQKLMVVNGLLTWHRNGTKLNRRTSAANRHQNRVGDAAQVTNDAQIAVKVRAGTRRKKGA